MLEAFAAVVRASETHTRVLRQVTVQRASFSRAIVDVDTIMAKDALLAAQRHYLNTVARLCGDPHPPATPKRADGPPYDAATATGMYDRDDG